MLCGLMLALVLFQLAIRPELTFRGRAADFPPGNQALGTQARVGAQRRCGSGRNPRSC